MPTEADSIDHDVAMTVYELASAADRIGPMLADPERRGRLVADLHLIADAHRKVGDVLAQARKMIREVA